MDYKEAIELLHPETSRNAIWKIADEENAIKKIEEALVMACEAMQELQEYKKLGTLEEVREAVEKQNECKNCGYKIHSDRISELNSCNDCGSANICEKRPEYGQYCRINCYDWSERE